MDDTVTDPTERGATDADDELFRRYVDTRDRRLRNQLVERYMGLAAHIARRYARAGMDDDIRQAAMIGLVKAVDRFDPEYGAAFSAFAGSTIEGELKRFLRDQTWVVKVPRSAKELHLLTQRAVNELQQRLGRSPSVDETAAHLGIDRDDVLRGLSAGAAYSVGGLDAGPSDRPGAPPVQHASEETGFEQATNEQLVAQLLARLPEREREIVRLRFFDELSQSQIAERVGMSQMHVSRLLRKAFDMLREHVDPDLAG